MSLARNALRLLLGNLSNVDGLGHVGHVKTPCHLGRGKLGCLQTERFVALRSASSRTWALHVCGRMGAGHDGDGGSRKKPIRHTTAGSGIYRRRKSRDFANRPLSSREGTVHCSVDWLAFLGLEFRLGTRPEPHAKLRRRSDVVKPPTFAATPMRGAIASQTGTRLALGSSETKRGLAPLHANPLTPLIFFWWALSDSNTRPTD